VVGRKESNFCQVELECTRTGNKNEISAKHWWQEQKGRPLNIHNL
jgi:hypothetical protein